MIRPFFFLKHCSLKRGIVVALAQGPRFDAVFFGQEDCQRSSGVKAILYWEDFLALPNAQNNPEGIKGKGTIDTSEILPELKAMVRNQKQNRDRGNVIALKPA